MHGESPAAQRRCNRQHLKHPSAGQPGVRCAVPAETLVVKAVPGAFGRTEGRDRPGSRRGRVDAHLRDLAPFVVAPQQEYAVRVPHFEREEEQERVQRKVAAVDEVACAAPGKRRSARGRRSRTKKEESALRRQPCHAKQLEQVVKLAVNVAHHLRGPGEPVTVQHRVYCGVKAPTMTCGTHRQREIQF